MIVSLSSNCVCIQGVVQKFSGTRWLSGEEPACQCRRHRRQGFNPWVGKICLSRKWQPAPVLLPGKFHRQKNLVDYSPWGCKESDATEHTHSLDVRIDCQFLADQGFLTSALLTLSSVQFSSVAQSCPTLCDPMNRSMPGLPVHHQLPEFTQTHIHRVSDAIQPSHPLSSPSSPAPNPSQHQSLFQ